MLSAGTHCSTISTDSLQAQHLLVKKSHPEMRVLRKMATGKANWQQHATPAWPMTRNAGHVHKPGCQCDNSGRNGRTRKSSEGGYVRSHLWLMSQ